MFKASKSVRFFFLNVSILSTLVIWLSQFTQMTSLLLSIPGLFLFAAITGWCPGMMLTRKLFGE